MNSWGNNTHIWPWNGLAASCPNTLEAMYKNKYNSYTVHAVLMSTGSVSKDCMTVSLSCPTLCSSRISSFSFFFLPSLFPPLVFLYFYLLSSLLNAAFHHHPFSLSACYSFGSCSFKLMCGQILKLPLDLMSHIVGPDCFLIFESVPVCVIVSHALSSPFTEVRKWWRRRKRGQRALENRT